ncbi:MAG: hypothetical protein V7K47_17940 [Nostoc sp.]
MRINTNELDLNRVLNVHEGIKFIPVRGFSASIENNLSPKNLVDTGTMRLSQRINQSTDKPIFFRTAEHSFYALPEANN